MGQLRYKSLCCASLLLGILSLLHGSPSLAATDSRDGATAPKKFHWIHANTDPELWEQILTAFNDELRPDDAKSGQSDLDTYRYKYIQKIGVANHSALVIIGRRPAKEVTEENKWDEYHTAFNFDLLTKSKGEIEHAAVMWQWKFAKLARFGSGDVPDVTYTYLSCTECEASKIFGALQFDEKTENWRVRSWGDGKEIWWAMGSGMVVDFDPAASDTISFDCVYGIRDLKHAGFDSFIMRCKAAGYEGTDTLKIQDDTLVYDVVDGQLKSRHATDLSEVAELTAMVCPQKSTNLLCRLPGYMTITGGQNAALAEWFPNAPKTVRELASFGKIQKTMSMMDVVSKCGRPDELGGSGIAIFIYHLDDGSLVAIGAGGPTGPLLYANHINSSGKSTALFPAEQDSLVGQS